MKATYQAEDHRILMKILRNSGFKAQGLVCKLIIGNNLQTKPPYLKIHIFSCSKRVFKIQNRCGRLILIQTQLSTVKNVQKILSDIQVYLVAQLSSSRIPI